MQQFKAIPWLSIWTVLVLYASVLIYRGYQYGTGDQSQILPCLYEQDHPGTYAKDHYVTHYLKAGLNERTVYHFLLRYLGYNEPWIMFLWHAVLSLTLLLAWWNITAFGVKSYFFRVLALAFIFIAGAQTATGANEVYYNSLVPSLAAKALGSWALYHWLRGNHPWWLGLLAVAGFLQPLVGVQLFILTTAASLFSSVFNRKMSELPWRIWLIYLLVTGPWIYFLAKNNGAEKDFSSFMEFIEFRLPHHFLASTFGWKHLALFGIFSFIAIRYYKDRIRWFIIFILVGCVIYEVAVEYYSVPAVMYSQWWKTTLWLEALACIAIAAGFERMIHEKIWMKRFGYALPVILLGLTALVKLNREPAERPDYLFPWNKHPGDAVDISIQADSLTPRDAVFLVPVDFSAFRWYAKRSLYVDYKALFHQSAFIKDWYTRIKNIYAFGLAEKKQGFNIHAFSKALLEEPSSMSIDYWKKIGITHIVSPSAKITSLEKVATNETFTIYKLP